MPKIAADIFTISYSILKHHTPDPRGPVCRRTEGRGHTTDPANQSPLFVILRPV